MRKILLIMLGCVIISAFGYWQSRSFKQQVGAVSSAVVTSVAPNSPSASPTPTPTSPPAPKIDKNTTSYLLQNMHVTFDDEFNTFNQYLDKNGDVTCYGGGTGTWQTVYHFCSRTNPGNNEAEVYTDPQFLSYFKQTHPTISVTATTPFSVANGILSIKAAPIESSIQSAVGSWAKYTSGFISTQYSFSQEYGYFEMKAKVPAGNGLWPAFWLLPQDQSWPPEIDVMEAFGGKNSNNEGGLNSIHYASHTHTNNQSSSCGAWYNLGTDISNGFHTYGVDWEPTGITYYFDGKAYATCKANPEANKPFYMIANLAVGSDQSWSGSPDSSTNWPAYLQIDYIRAYQHN